MGGGRLLALQARFLADGCAGVRVVESTHRAHGLAKSDPVTDHQADCSTRRSSCRGHHQHLARWGKPTCPGYHLARRAKVPLFASPLNWRQHGLRAVGHARRGPQGRARRPRKFQQLHLESVKTDTEICSLRPTAEAPVSVSAPASITGGGRSICRPIWKSPPKQFDRRRKRTAATTPTASRRSSAL